MSASEPPSSADTQPAEGRSREPLGPLGRASRRWVRRTTDLIAIGLLLMAALTVAGRIAAWWDEPPPTTPSAADEPAWSGAEGIEFQAGDAPVVMRRQVIAGDATAALECVVKNCRLLLEDTTVIDLPPLDDRERRLMAKLEGREPVAADSNGEWVVHRLPGPLPLTVGVRMRDRPATNVAGTTGAARRMKRSFVRRSVVSLYPVKDEAALHPTKNLAAPSDGAQSAPRVICWGLTFPTSEQTWTVLTVRMASGAASSGSPIVAIPPGSRRSLAVRDARGGSLSAFSGGGPAEAWREHFNRRLEDDGWRAAAEWRQSGDHWTAQWERIAAAGRYHCEIHLGPSHDGWSGLIHITNVREQ